MLFSKRFQRYWNRVMLICIDYLLGGVWCECSRRIIAFLWKNNVRFKQARHTRQSLSLGESVPTGFTSGLTRFVRTETFYLPQQALGVL